MDFRDASTAQRLADLKRAACPDISPNTASNRVTGFVRGMAAADWRRPARRIDPMTGEVIGIVPATDA